MSDACPSPMTSRERLLAAARCAPCDRVPVSPFGLGRLDPDSAAAEEMVRCCDPFIITPGGANVFGGCNYHETWREEGDLRIGTIHTPAGDLTRTVKTTAAARHLIEYPCKGPADLERYLSIPFEPDEPDLTAYRAACARYGEEALVLIDSPNAICLPAELLAPEDFCLLWADAPDLMRTVTEEGARRLKTFADAACRAGARAARIIGGEYASVQLGPAAFEELVVPHDRRLVDILHRHGALAYYHNHGPMMRYLEPIARISADFLDPLEMPPYGDVDLERAREIIAGRYCIVGTFDDMEMLEKWPAERIRDQVVDRLRSYGERGVCIGGSASGTFTERAARAFCAMAEAVAAAA